MLALLPQDIICHVASFVNVCDGWDLCNISNEFIEYNGTKKFYPLYYLYATCKSFEWLLTKEFIHVYIEGEYRAHIATKNIQGKRNGMSYNFNDRIYGYAYYECGQCVYQNTCNYDYRYINGKKEINLCRGIDGKVCKEYTTCKRYGYCKYCDNIMTEYSSYAKYKCRIPTICQYCPILTKVTEYVMQHDALVNNLLNTYDKYTAEDSIWMRDKTNFNIFPIL